MEIREAIIGDAPAITRLGVAIQERHFANRPDWFKPPSTTESAALYEALLGQTDTTAYVAEVNGELVGFVVARTIRQPETPLTWAQVIIQIDQIEVVASARRRGVGHALIDAVRELATGQTASLLRLTAWEFSDEAQRFFEAEGVRVAMRQMTMPWPQRRLTTP